MEEITKEQVIDEIKRRNKNIYGDCTYGQLTRDEKIQVDILEDILKFAGEYKDDDESKDTWDVNSIGHRFFEHYKIRAIIEYLDKMMDNMRESVVYRFIEDGELSEDTINHLKELKKMYEDIKIRRLTLEEKNEDEGLIEWDDHVAFMKYIEAFSLKDDNK